MRDNNSALDEQSGTTSSSPTRSTITSSHVDTMIQRSLTFRNSNRNKKRNKKKNKKKNKNVNPPKTFDTSNNSELVGRSGSIRKQAPQTKSVRLKNSEITELKKNNSLSATNYKSGFYHGSNIFNSPGGRLSRCNQSVKTEENGNKMVKNEALPANTSFDFYHLNLNKMYQDWDCNEIIAYIYKNSYAFHSLLKENPRPDILQLLMKIVVKIIDTTFTESKIEVYSHLCDDCFVQHLILYISSTVSENDSSKHESIIVFFSNLNLFLEDIINLMPYKSLETLYNLVVVEKVVLNQLQKRWSDFSDVANVAEKLKGDLDIIKDRCIEIGDDPKELKNWKKSTPPNDFHEISIYPTSEDLRRNNFLRENIIKGSYEDVSHYLDVQFRLLREDFIDPLRDGIWHYKRSLISSEQVQKRNFNVQIYKNVEFLNTDLNRFSHYDLTIKIHEKLTRDIKWEYSKRLRFGSLVLFSKDNFETFQLATVSDRDLEELCLHGTLNVSLVGENIFGNELFTSEFVMAESSAFFEPIYQVLKTIKELPTDSFPMERYLLVHDISPSLPSYLIDKPLINIKNNDGQLFTVNINDNSSWPPCHSLNLNPSQASAFKSVMKNEFSVVQGPPGTGKKYLGFKIVQTILENFNFGSPILLVSYTNHALDKFLEGLLTVTKDIIRIGDQSKNEVLNKFNFRNVRKTHFRRNPAIPKLKKALTECLAVLNSNNKLLEGIVTPAGIINIVKYTKTKFHDIITFENSNDYLSWILGDSYEFLNYITNEYGASSKAKPLLVCKGTYSPCEGDEYNIDDDEAIKRKKDYFNLYNIDKLEDLHVNFKGQIYYTLTLKKLENLKSNMTDYLFKLNSNNGSHDDEKQVVSNDLRKFQEFIYELKSRLTNKNQKPSTQLDSLLKLNIWCLSDDDRWALYHTWIQQVEDYTNKDITDQNAIRTELLKVWNDIKVMEDFETLNNLKPKILGLTTTGATRHHNLISLLKPSIIIVQEAAEVLESHIVTTLTSSCQHLILIGDHNQLKPHPSSNLLADKYHLDVSLIERMVNNGISSHTLTVQHRMKPNIASLIVPTIYPELTNHSSVELYPPVLGISKNLFFINHNFFEINVEEVDKECKENPHEAEFLILLCRHLLLQGYNPSDITILTTYSAQLIRLLKFRKQWPLLNEVKITLVDNYTGEESNIVLLSLVRSNMHGKIGFLGIKNRISVALSRAKFGLYIIGNMDLLMSNSQTWREIYFTLKSQEAIGKSLSLVCQVHAETVTEVKCANDFTKVSGGGCNRICSRLMECGHTCISQCHVINLEHKNLQCQLPCNRLICQEPNHSCPLQCYQTCLPCEVLIRRILPKCKHEVELQCNVNIEDYQCLVEVKKMLLCGHTFIMPCSDISDDSKIVCLSDCGKLLPCGHVCQKKCRELCGDCTVEVEKTLLCGHTNIISCFLEPCSSSILCLEDCGKLLPCGHICQKKCHELCWGCTVEVEKSLSCGHTLIMPCSQDPDSSILCLKDCGKLLPCGHLCQKKCHELSGDCTVEFKCNKPCTKKNKGCKQNHLCLKECWENCFVCTILVKKTLLCGHTDIMPCFQDSSSSRILCYMDCGKLLPCGHVCQKKCYELCGDCTVEVEKTLSCGHTLIMPCSQDADSSILCLKDCGKLLPCGHICQRKCHEICQICREEDKMLPCGHTLLIPCFQDPGSKIQCHRACGKLLPCGHKCQRKCHQLCEDCIEKVEKTLPCDHTLIVPCLQDLDSVLCPRNCERILPCGHKCQRKCHDLCGGCTEEVEKTLPCGHTLKIPCFQDPDSVLCSRNCEKLLSCGHQCQRNCQDLCGGCIIQVKKILPCAHTLKIPCFQDPGSVLCPRICGKVLPCGHICQRKCHDPCGGCTDECNEICATESGTEDLCCQCTIL